MRLHKYLRKEEKEKKKKKKRRNRQERERYTQLNAEFQRIARRGKKALSEQCKEIEENNRMGNTGDLFKKIKDIMGIFHERMAMMKDRKGKDLIEAEDIRRGGKNTQNYTKKSVNDWDNDNGVVTYLEPDIMECELKWALGSIRTNKASGDDGIPAELFKNLKKTAAKVLQSVCQ